MNTYAYVAGNPLVRFDPLGLRIVGEYFSGPELTISRIGYRSTVDRGDPKWDPTSAWRNGWVDLRGEGTVDLTVHCIEYSDCEDIIDEWFVDKSFFVFAEKRFEIRQNFVLSAWAYKLMEMKQKIENMLHSQVAQYALDPTTWCILSRFRVVR